MTTNLRFARIFLILAVMTITAVIVSIFVSFHLRTEKLTEAILLQQARALYSELIMTRRWVSGHGGVYVRVKPGVDPNPFLTKLPDLKVNLTDQHGTLYTLRNPGLVVRGISEMAEEIGQFRFHVASLNPVNKETNSPDPFEHKALLGFELGEKESFAIEMTDSGPVYRYMAPLLYEDKCDKCHAFQNYEIGDIRGGISVSIPMTDVNHRLKANRLYTIISAVAILGILFTSLYFLSSRFMRKLDDAQSQLLYMATTDGLTKLCNRKTALERLEQEIAKHFRFHKPLSCLLLDIDHFKMINDTYGHLAGDAVLVALADIFVQHSRKYDILCRYGGEEFIIILPETSLKTALAVAEKLRAKIEGNTVSYNQHAIKVTASIGVAQSSLEIEEEAYTLISRADRALYQAKLEGRNMVVAV